jgi:hypothetical protein
MPGKRKERWPYLRAALSSTINYTEYLQYIQPILVVLQIYYKYDLYDWLS